MKITKIKGVYYYRRKLLKFCSRPVLNLTNDAEVTNNRHKNHVWQLIWSLVYQKTSRTKEAYGYFLSKRLFRERTEIGLSSVFKRVQNFEVLG